MRLIDADALKEHLDYVCVGGGKWGDAEKAFINAFKDFVDGEITIQLEPKSAQQWIPCSEGLPDYHDEVLVTSRGEVAIAWLYIDDNWRSNDMPESMYKDIVAWMPLPEPYKKGDAE